MNCKSWGQESLSHMTPKAYSQERKIPAAKVSRDNYLIINFLRIIQLGRQFLGIHRYS